MKTEGLNFVYVLSRMTLLSVDKIAEVYFVLLQRTLDGRLAEQMHGKDSVRVQSISLPEGYCWCRYNAWIVDGSFNVRGPWPLMGSFLVKNKILFLDRDNLLHPLAPQK